MDSVVLHPLTQKHIAGCMRDMPQSLLLGGLAGVGLKTIALAMAGDQLASLIRPQDKKNEADDEHGAITVEMIRRLHDQTRSKQTDRRIIIIDNADKMSRGAQNAFLKLLEEPARYVHFILTSHASQQLLPTIHSRVQKLAILPITANQTGDYIASLAATDATKRRQLEFIASGLPAELARLMADEAYFKAKATLVTDARDFLMADAYKKTIIIQKYYTDREATLQLVDSVLSIARRSLSTKPQPALIRQVGHLLEARENIAANYNIRLQLMRIVL